MYARKFGCLLGAWIGMVRIAPPRSGLLSRSGLYSPYGSLHSATLGA